MAGLLLVKGLSILSNLSSFLLMMRSSQQWMERPRELYYKSRLEVKARSTSPHVSQTDYPGMSSASFPATGCSWRSVVMEDATVLCWISVKSERGFLHLRTPCSANSGSVANPPTQLGYFNDLEQVNIRDVREWLSTFPFPPILIYSIPIPSHSHSVNAKVVYYN